MKFKCLKILQNKIHASCLYFSRYFNAEGKIQSFTVPKYFPLYIIQKKISFENQSSASCFRMNFTFDEIKIFTIRGAIYKL